MHKQHSCEAHRNQKIYLNRDTYNWAHFRNTVFHFDLIKEDCTSYSFHSYLLIYGTGRKYSEYFREMLNQLQLLLFEYIFLL